MREVGIYLGNKKLSVATTENQKLISFTDHTLQEAQDDSDNDELNFEVSLNKISRELKLNPNETINLSIADKEFIIRSFVIPSMSRKEIESSMEFEIDKYIPFKMADLEWNYSYDKLSGENKILISFIGYKRNNFTQYTESFSRLGFTPMIIEPGCLSLMRMIRSLSGYSRLQWYAVLEVTPKQGYITFFYKTLPVFSRVVNVDHEGEIDAAKVLEETRFSFQYFKREFRAHDLEKMIVVTQEDPASLASLGESLELPVDFLQPSDCVNSSDTLDVPRLKAYSVAAFEHFPRRFSPCLKSESPFLGKVKDKVSPLGTALAVGIVVVGLIVTVMINMSYHSKIVMQEKILAAQQEKVQLSEDLKRQKIRDIKRYIDEKEEQINVLAAKIKSNVPVARILYQLQASILSGTEGLWLDRIDFREAESQGASLRFLGYVYMGDSRKETLSLDRFMLNLNRNEVIKKMFPRLELVGKDRKTYGGFDVTQFVIRLY